MHSTEKTLLHGLQSVVGKKLLSVNFVEDYVQLAWDGSSLSAFSMPVITHKATRFSSNDADYKVVMWRLEDQKTEKVDVVPEKAVVLHFGNSARLEISILDADYVGPEILHFRNADGLLWVV